jgi:hypothetical protein
LTARCRQLGASPTISSSQVGAGCCSPQPVRAVVRTSSCSRPTSRRRTGLSRMTLRRVFRMIRVRGRNARTGQVPRPRAGVLKGHPSPSLIPLTSGARSASDGRLRGREPRVNRTPDESRPFCVALGRRTGGRRDRADPPRKGRGRRGPGDGLSGRERGSGSSEGCRSRPPPATWTRTGARGCGSSSWLRTAGRSGRRERES